MSTEATETAVVKLPPKVALKVEKGLLVAEGPGGQVTRPFPTQALKVSVGSGQATLSLQLPSRKRTRALLGTWRSHVANLVAGAAHGYEARAKAVSAHFPMKLSARDGGVVIENFLGEKHPRRSPLVGATKAQVQGEELLLSGPSLEDVGQSAANLERATHIRNYDPRVFQDGIYITLKPRPKESA